MNTLTALHVGSATHPGLQRTVNEDRVCIDEAHGILLVIDGLGGHLAGETAAETAAQVIGEHLLSIGTATDAEQGINEAIVAANNRIFELAQSREEWIGMACVLTLAFLRDEQVIVGHVGDSRLYLIRNGTMQKMTSDQSPVGELEESGELTEAEAMRHPRRHEVFRDVGSEPRQPDDPQFVQIKKFPFPPDAALLLCTDGLTDSVTAAGINQILGNYRGDSEEIANALVEAANAAGGKDNVSVIFVAGPDFRPDQQAVPQEGGRHSITRMRLPQSRWTAVWQRLPFLLAGMLIGSLLWAAAEKLMPHMAESGGSPPPVRLPVHIAVNAGDPRGITAALRSALPGDVIEVPPGEYLGPLLLKDQVSVIGSLPRRPVLRSDPATAANQGVALTATGVHNARVENLEIAGDQTHPLRIGMSIAHSAVNVANCKVSGAIDAGVRIEDKSEATLMANVLSENPGAGLTIQEQSFVRLISNWITDNGRTPEMPRAGLEAAPTVQLEAANNLFLHNGLSDLNALPRNLKPQLRDNNIFEWSSRVPGKP